MSMETDDQEAMFRDAVRRFVERDVTPNAQKIEAGEEFPQWLVEEMAKLGLFGMVIPQEYGGVDAKLTTYAAVMEELSAGWSSLPSFLNSHGSVSGIITQYGTPEQRARYLPKLADGSMRGAVMLSEPDAGTDLQSIRTTATRQADGSYVLSGTKVFITNGERASLFLVLVKTDPKAQPTKDGISLMILEKGTPGFSVARLFDKMAFKHVDTAELLLEDVRLPADSIVGGVPGRGFGQLMSTLETGRVAMAATAVGLARSALAASLSYSKERKTFGVPIASHQAIQIHLANMATKLAAARCLVMEAARVKEQGGRADMLAGMAKLYASEACLEITGEAMRVHGGYGYVSDFPIERMYREAPLYVLTEGTNEIQRTIIAKRLISGDGAASIGIY
ncbi:Acyl-CoA dehydrogenase (plasmid) [Cupriavidus necator H850]|uniref:acyl-CoA dehydrogenase family protein n=2 Tax=Cupriavidus necator TaxID=106590 RepID=UPI00129D5C04|nr:acyl-CoA dehydrogenase family protein [Cupriavidus necator]KAI3602706.1 Acyl-CoA dehydrogenase [Cupriavidus necator H850]